MTHLLADYPVFAMLGLGALVIGGFVGVFHMLARDSEAHDLTSERLNRNGEPQ